MIYRYHTFEIYPWGAVLNLKCIEASKQVYTVDEDNYSTSTSYKFKYGPLGDGKSYFIESKEQPVIMKFENKFKNNKSVNGDIVSISSNMTITTNETYKISGDSNNYIKKFTINNTSWFNLPYPSETTTIQKIIQTTYLTITKDLYGSINFYNGNIGIQQSFSSGKNYYFNSLNAPNGATIKANYNYLQEITETKIATGTNVVWQVTPTHQVISTIEIYNVTKGKTVSNYSYNSSYNNYYYYGYLSYSQVSIGDTVRIKYKYAIPYEENLIVREYEENTLHRGTLSNENKNKPIEDCKDSDGKYVFYTRDTSNKQYIYLKTDTYDNKQLTVRFEKERPYVKLYCNNVKVETRMVELGGYNNGFSKITKDDTYIYPSSDVPALHDLKAKLLRKIKISWSKSEYNQLYYGETHNSSDNFGYNQYLFYGFYNNTNSQLKYINKHSENSYGYTIPAIKDLNNPYYSIGYIVNFGGEGLYACNTQQYIDEKILGYTSNGRLINLNERKDINREYNSGTPSLTTLEKWGSNNSFYTSGYDDNITYISPSDGYELLTDWSVQYICGDCSECGECGQCGQCDGGGTQYFDAWTGDVCEQGSDGKWYHNGTTQYVPAGNYSIVGYYEPEMYGTGYPIINYDGIKVQMKWQG